jgi:hypothetical protein
MAIEKKQNCVQKKDSFTEIFSQVKSFIALMFADGGGAFYIWIFLFPVMESLAFRTNCL